jgi:2-hydroxy-palmitic acid dioxygenase Mpo1-like
MPATDTVPKFLERRPLLRALYRGARNWRERHQHPFNFWIHHIGIPMALGGIVLLFTLPWTEWYWGVGLFVGGYLLQWIGHKVEGNDLGEWAAIKRMFGLPYVSIAPRYAKPETPSNAQGNGPAV